MRSHNPLTMNSLHGVWSGELRPYSLKLGVGKASSILDRSLPSEAGIVNHAFTAGQPVADPTLPPPSTFFAEQPVADPTLPPPSTFFTPHLETPSIPQWFPNPFADQQAYSMPYQQLDQYQQWWRNYRQWWERNKIWQEQQVALQQAA